jgi:hypothetical protein
MAKRFIVSVATDSNGGRLSIQLQANAPSDAIRLASVAHPSVDWSQAQAWPVNSDWKIPGHMLPSAF